MNRRRFRLTRAPSVRLWRYVVGGRGYFFRLDPDYAFGLAVLAVAADQRDFLSGHEDLGLATTSRCTTPRSWGRPMATLADPWRTTYPRGFSYVTPRTVRLTRRTCS